MRASDDLSIPPIAYEKFVLPNGLTVLIHEDHKAPIVAVNVWYHVGSKNEPTDKTGFAHLFEHLMFNGSEHYNQDYFKPFDQVGATDMNGTTNADRTNYFQNVPPTALNLALENTYPEGHPYDHTVIGSMKDLNAASLTDVHEWFDTYYGPNNATLVIAGDVDTQTALAKAKHYVGGIEPGPPVKRQVTWMAKREGSHRQVIQDRVPQHGSIKSGTFPR